MFATDFLFDGQRASDFGLMICSFNGEFETVSGGDIEYNVIKTPNRDKFTFYGAQLNSAIMWNFSICKNPCKNDDLYFDQYEESMIAKWLVKTDGFKWFQFDQEEYEDIFYNVYINMAPQQVNGRTVGFNLSVTSDCAYGFTDIIIKRFTINSSTPFKLNIHSDINTYILPYVKIINGKGNFYISNDSDILQNNTVGKAMEFKNVSKEIVIDSDTDIILGLSNSNNFNWYFLRLVDGINIITTNSNTDIKIEIQYREPRFVRI